MNINDDSLGRAHRIGFTLVELLVVIAIIGTLVALLLPAVQAAREAARRSQCTNNQKQLGIALQNYHDACGTLPAGHMDTYNPPNTALGARHHFGWLTALLPFVEEGALYERIDFAAVTYLSPNIHTNPAFEAVGGVDVATFLCPSDPVGRVILPSPNLNFAPANYFGSQGNLCDCRAKNCDGLFGHSSYTRMKWITDGTSKTIAFGETLKGDRDANTTVDNYIFLSGGPTALNASNCQASPPNASDRGTVWIGGQPQFNIMTTKRTPNDALFDCISPNYGCTNFAARSAHAGGALLTFADGSVHFIAEDVDLATYNALGSRAGGDTVGEY